MEQTCQALAAQERAVARVRRNVLIGIPNGFEEALQLILLFLFALDTREDLGDVASVVPVVEDADVHAGL